MEQQLTETIKDLQQLWFLLEQAKHTRPPRENTGAKTTPTPQTPGGYATQLDVELTTRLAEITLDIRNHLTPRRSLPRHAPTLLGYLRFHAPLIIELDWAEDIIQELQDQRAALVKYLHPPTTKPTPQGVYNSTPATLQVLAYKGHSCTAEDLRRWSKRGNISRIHDSQGRNMYRIDEVLAYLQTKKDHNTN